MGGGAAAGWVENPKRRGVSAFLSQLVDRGGADGAADGAAAVVEVITDAPSAGLCIS